MLSTTKTSCLIAIAVHTLSTQVLPQESSPQGFRFHRDDDQHVVAVQYWGSTGLRSGKLHEFPKLDCVYITYGTGLTKDDVAYLSTLTNLEELEIGQDLVDTPVTIEGDLSKLANLKSLEWLHLCKQNPRDTDLAFVASLPKLTHLEFNADSEFHGGKTTITDQCGDFLRQAKSLESVYIQGDGRLTDKFVSKLANGLPKLEHLNMRCDRLTDESLRLLALHSKNLNWLDISSDKFSDRGVKHLSNAKNLRRLWLDSSSLSKACVEHVKGLRKLKHLELTIPTIDDGGVKVIASLRRLELLALRQPALTNEQFAIFRDHPRLESAFINGTKLDDERTVELIGQIPNLSHLSVGSKNPDLQAAINGAILQKPNSRD